MKKALIIFLIPLLLILSSCKSSFFIFEDEESQGIFFHEYDFGEDDTLTLWEYGNTRKMQGILDMLHNLKGRKVEKIEEYGGEEVIYELNIVAPLPKYLLIIGDYVIDNKGDIYSVNTDKLIKAAKTIELVKDQTAAVPFIHGHRALSLLEGRWDTTYMYESQTIVSDVPGLAMMVWKSDDLYNYTISNNIDDNINFGYMYSLETYINNKWYPIDDMVNRNMNFEFAALGFGLSPGEAYDLEFDLSMFLPLPSGRYRILKDIYIEKEAIFISAEFDIDD